MNNFHDLLITFLTSMVPVIELRGSIPVGIANGLNPMSVFVVSVIGNMIPVPFVILLFRRVLEFGKKTKLLRWYFTWLEEHATKNGEKIRKYEILGLIILVAIPLPGTGAWTGAMAATLLDIRMRKSIPAIFIGVIIAGIVVTAISCGISAVV